MIRDVPLVNNPARQSRRQIGIDQETQSGHLNHRVVKLARRVFESCHDVISFKVRVVAQDLFLSGARRKQVKDVGNSHTQPPNTGAPSKPVRVKPDALNLAHRAYSTELDRAGGGIIFRTDGAFRLLYLKAGARGGLIDYFDYTYGASRTW
ncbi:MAG: hypothetical protein HW416_1341 [Chloroflexi bacterium]|nr:hypothetical protein [Chloroflexota bacterium]